MNQKWITIMAMACLWALPVYADDSDEEMPWRRDRPEEEMPWRRDKPVAATGQPEIEPQDPTFFHSPIYTLEGDHDFSLGLSFYLLTEDTFGSGDDAWELLVPFPGLDLGYRYSITDGFHFLTEVKTFFFINFYGLGIDYTWVLGDLFAVSLLGDLTMLEIVPSLATGLKLSVGSPSLALSVRARTLFLYLRGGGFVWLPHVDISLEASLSANTSIYLRSEILWFLSEPEILFSGGVNF